MINQRDRYERAFEAFEMPEPAFERMFGRHERRRRAQRISSAVLAVVITVFAIAMLARTLGTEQPTGRQSTPRIVDRPALTRILPPDTSEPGGLPYIATSAGVSGVTRPLQGSPLSASRAVQVGFVDAMVLEFSSGEDAFIGTFVAAYGDAASAEVALRVFRTRFQSDYQYVDPPTDPGLGPDGFYFREDDIPPTYTCLWRRGNLILNVHGFGSIDPGLVLRVAEQMDARALREGGA